MWYSPQRYNPVVQTLFIAFLSFAAYSMGAVIARRCSSSQRGRPAHPIEALVVASVIFLLCIFHQSHFHLFEFPIYAAVMVMVGILVVWLTFDRSRSAGTREFEDSGHATSGASVWKRWVNFSRAIADFEVRLLLVATYLLLVGPIAIASRLKKSVPAASGWVPRNDISTLDAARRPF